MATSNSDLFIDTSTRCNVIDGLLSKLRTYYVFPEVVDHMEQFIRRRVRDGEYNAITTASALCEALTLDMRTISHDRHLCVQYCLDAQPHREKVWEDAKVVEDHYRAVTVINFDFRKVEWLPGNIGYLDLRAFVEPEYAGETAVAAMTLLANTSALIIDLRHNGGGSPEMVAFLASYLFKKPVHLDNFYWRHGDATRPDGSIQQLWTLPYVPGKRYDDKPVYILTSGDTFSSAEQFAYCLQQLKRATIIGGTTKCGGNPGDEYQIDQHFQVFIPTGRAINPITGTSFEGTGVIPDIEVRPEDALETAHAEALQTVLESIGNDSTDPLKALVKQEVQKALKKRSQA